MYKGLMLNVDGKPIWVEWTPSFSAIQQITYRPDDHCYDVVFNDRVVITLENMGSALFQDYTRFIRERTGVGE